MKIFAQPRRRGCSWRLVVTALPVVVLQWSAPSSQGFSVSSPIVSSPGSKTRDEVVESFISAVQSSLPLHQENVAAATLVSLTLRGPSKKKLLQQNNEEQTRGCLRMATGRLVETKNQGVVLHVTLKYHLATDICKNWSLDQVGTGLRTLLLGNDNNETAAGLVPTSEWGGATTFGSIIIHTATLETTSTVYELQLRAKRFRLISRKNKPMANTSARPTTTTHDRTKQVPLVPTADFLQALGVTNSQGQPRPGMKSKLRQCQKFVEICSHLLMADDDTNNKDISVVDMGCGRGYLTFSLHSFLTAKGCNVESRGIDIRPKLVDEINGIARSLGNDFRLLRFEQGTIENFWNASSYKPTTSSKGLSVLIALHACDTATDDALWSAISNKQDVIVVAPCCHKQLRPQLNQHYTACSNDPTQLHPLADVLRHNIYRERLAETVTDSMRALLLEIAGYNVKVFEFIGGEHTSKNVMITAVKKPNPPKDKSALCDRLRSLAAFHGIREHQVRSLFSCDASVADVLYESFNRLPLTLSFLHSSLQPWDRDSA